METPATVQMLNLRLPTDPRWVNLAEMDLSEILTDHAYCEQKAATSCISLIQGYPERHELVRELAPIVTEEWGHFRAVLAELDRRGLPWAASGRMSTSTDCWTFPVRGGAGMRPSSSACSSLPSLRHAAASAFGS